MEDFNKIDYAEEQRAYFAANRDFDVSFYGKQKGNFDKTGKYAIVFNHFIGKSVSTNSVDFYRRKAIEHIRKNNLILDSMHKIKGFMCMFILVDFFKAQNDKYNG